MTSHELSEINIEMHRLNQLISEKNQRIKELEEAIKLLHKPSLENCSRFLEVEKRIEDISWGRDDK